MLHGCMSCSSFPMHPNPLTAWKLCAFWHPGFLDVMKFYVVMAVISDAKWNSLLNVACHIVLVLVPRPIHAYLVLKPMFHFQVLSLFACVLLEKQIVVVCPNVVRRLHSFRIISINLIMHNDSVIFVTMSI